MSSQFTYPSFRCILEYLEANKRIHICARSKALQKIDKKIPLHIKSLTFLNFTIFVNNIPITLDFDVDDEEEVLVDGVFRNWNQVLMPGDVCLKDGEFYNLSNTENLEIRNQKACEINFCLDNPETRRVPSNIPCEIAMKKIATVLFGGRSSIHVSELTVYDSLLRLPVGFNIRIRRSWDIGSSNLDRILCIIDPQSFPLKHILCPRTPEEYLHPIVQTAETLTAVVDRRQFLQEPWHREILRFPNKHINVISTDLNYDDVVSVVQGWMDHPREHGRTFTLGWIDGMEQILYQIENRFNGKAVLILDDDDNRIYPEAVIIPIDSTSELFVSGVGGERIKLERVPIKTIQSTTHFDSVEEHFENRFADAMFISVSLAICVGAIYFCRF